MLLSKLYQFYRCSSWYERVSRLRGTQYAHVMDCDREFFRGFFDSNSIRTVFDVGSNVGDKATIFLEIADRVLCVEADPRTATGLKSRFAFRKRVVIENVAVGAEVGSAKLFRKNYSGFNTLSQKWSDAAGHQGVSDDGAVEVPVTTLDLLIAKHGVPDYIKIDVEGYELPSIRGLNKSIRALSFEANVPTFFDETKEIIGKLIKLQPKIRFNLRIMEAPGFHLANFVDTETLIAKLVELSPFTCDVFAVESSI